jgi:hypothetical protein
MSSVKECDALRDRFIEEQEYVQRYIELLQRKISLDTGELHRAINTLDEYGFERRENLYKGVLLFGKTPSSVEIQELLSNLQRVKPDIQKAITEAEKKLSQVERPKDLNKVDARSLAGECIDYLVETLGRDPSPNDIAVARRELREQLERSEEEPVFIANDLGSIDQLVGYSIDSALYLIPSREISKLHHTNNDF